MLHEIADFGTVFLREAVTGGVRYIDDRCPRFQDGLHDAGQELVIGAASIFCVEFHIFHE